MTIPYKNRKGYFKNYYQKNKPIKGVKSVKINTNDLTPNQGVKNEGVKKGVNLTPQIQELKEEINELKKELVIVKNQLENLQQLLTKKPTEISIKKEPSKVIKQESKNSNSATQTATNKVTFSYNKNILANIQSFLTENPQSFPSFSHFIRAALIAYQNGMKIDEGELISTSKKDTEKKSLRMDREIQNIYRTLPEGKKYLVLNQILASFLSSQS